MTSVWSRVRCFAHWKEPGQIGISFPGGGGPRDAKMATEAAEREALKRDNRKKLGTAGTRERHLVVYMYLTNYLPWRALVDLDPPPDLLSLPSEITDIWLFSETGSQSEYVVWRAGTSVRWHSQRHFLNVISLAET
jgi:hypothetical protein